MAHTEQLTNKMRLYIVQPMSGSNAKFVTWAMKDDDARQQAHTWFGYDGGPSWDKYVVTPITKPGDRIHMSITLNT